MAHTIALLRGARFGVFEVDFLSGELRKRGIKIPIQGQPLQVLQMLVEHSGEVVTRQDLRERLWPADTFVDFENGLNNAINKLRLALGDSSNNPRFVETLSRRGYRFIAPLQEWPRESQDEREPAIRSETGPGRRVSLVTVGAFAVLAASGLLALYWFFPARPPNATRLAQLTDSVAVEPWGQLVTDGARLYFLERERDHWNVVQTSVSGGPVEPFPAPFQSTRILDVSPDL